jgi:hypothetical protein
VLCGFAKADGALQTTMGLVDTLNLASDRAKSLLSAPTYANSRWPAPGFKDTEIGFLMKAETGHREMEVHREFKLEAVRLIKDRGVSYVQASRLQGTTRRLASRRRLDHRSQGTN